MGASLVWAYRHWPAQWVRQPLGNALVASTRAWWMCSACRHTQSAAPRTTSRAVRGATITVGA